MFELKNRWLGDTWYYVQDQIAHMYFLTCSNDIPRHKFWQIGHATSTDLKNWNYQGILFSSNANIASQSCLSTGSVCRWEGRYLMSFLGNHNNPDPCILYAWSMDLYHWQLLPRYGSRLSDTPYSKRGSLSFKNPRWRDPYLFVEKNWLYQFVTAADESLPSTCDGVVAVMRTKNLVDWEYLPHLKTPVLGTDLECPKVYRIGEFYVLLVSMFNVLQEPGFAAKQPKGLNSSTTFCLVAKDFDGDWLFHGNGRVLQRDYPGGPYACEAVYFRDNWYLLGTCWSDRKGDQICDPIHLEACSRGLRDVTN